MNNLAQINYADFFKLEADRSMKLNWIIFKKNWRWIYKSEDQKKLEREGWIRFYTRIKQNISKFLQW